MEIEVKSRDGKSFGTFQLPEKIKVKDFKRLFHEKCKFK